jgi:hypothetical protein
MEKVRRVKKILKSIPVLEGAGVHLKRAFEEYQNKTFLKHQTP